MVTSPSLGERYEPFGAHLQDPYPFYALARASEPVFFSPALGAWVVTRYEDIRQVHRDPETFSSANALRPVFRFYPATLEELQKGFPMVPTTVDSDGELHRRLREPLTKALTPEKVAALEPFIRGRANALVDAFVDDHQAELMGQYAYQLPVEVIAELLGLNPADRPRHQAQLPVGRADLGGAARGRAAGGGGRDGRADAHDHGVCGGAPRHATT